MFTELIKFDKCIDSWDIGFHITLTNQELSKCDMDSIKHINGCETELKDNVMSFNYVFFKKNLKKGETIFERFAQIQNCVEHMAASSLTLTV